MKSLLPLAVAAALSIGVYGEARAELPTIGKVSATGRSWLTPSCARLAAQYADGTNLTFAINNHGVLVIGIENDA